ncbi:hypothetical protein ANO14919_087750 [Xylariales sp. No.14919]|nr:hypothetical protein ANO14919_087750 [Xylariales sp. No.14919]
MASLTGKASFPCVGSAVPPTARISDMVHGGGNLWSDYAEAAYEDARVGRWREFGANGDMDTEYCKNIIG